MRQAILRAVLLVALLAALVVCLKVTSGWWRGELSLADSGNWFWVLLFPVLIVVWWRYFSIFGCAEATCLLPKDKEG
jgi:hypothetical protein